MNIQDNGEWYEDYAEENSDEQIEEYDISASPNDFNILTIFSFLESGVVKIPGFQRNYVWDIKRASKLIESLILGLPVPQVFLYETDRNKFQVIDGQQRLMSIYYFMKQRFPKKEKRAEIRKVFDENGRLPDNCIHNDDFFENFRLTLADSSVGKNNKFKGMAYQTLGEYKQQFELRTIRNVIIKQNSPKEDDSSMFEVFNRLNTGGINLMPQEIRISMYHSKFYEMLYHANSESAWRKILLEQEPDIHMKDIEILLRGFAMMIDGKNYAPSMMKFLNKFSRKCRAYNQSDINYFAGLFDSFLKACARLPNEAFKKNGRFNIALYEATFTACCEQALKDKAFVSGELSYQSIAALEKDPEFVNAMQEGTTKILNVKKRLERAKELIKII
jgi:uncharacterized protein with ParB-like and HNH nuclease domain